MKETDKSNNRKSEIERAIEIAIRISILGLLMLWCFQILRPFIAPVIWGVIIAVAIYSPYNKLKSLLGDRNKLAATIMTLLVLAVLVVPSVQLTSSLIDGLTRFGEGFQGSSFTIAPPPEGVGDWPLIGKSLERTWSQASQNLEAVLSQFAPQIKAASIWLLESILGTGMGILQFIFSIIIAGIFLASSRQSSKAAHDIFVRLAGDKGAEFAKVSETTIRNVVKGILGVAAIQAFLAGLGFVFADVPAAGLWVLLCLILAIIQIGIIPVVIPVIIYMFYSADTLTATILAVYLIFVSLVDNFLKPVLLGRGAPVPMLVIFLGSIGGFILSGFVGLFVGAIILSLGFKLFQAWLYEEQPEAAP
jgi:predicted PurR-regulated permease PerM